MSKSVVVVMCSQTRALQELSGANSLVVATGGGAVVRDENWYIFSNYSLSVRLGVVDIIGRDLAFLCKASSLQLPGVMLHPNTRSFYQKPSFVYIWPGFFSSFASLLSCYRVGF
jgi:hypothetical protein